MTNFSPTRLQIAELLGHLGCSDSPAVLPQSAHGWRRAGGSPHSSNSCTGKRNTVIYTHSPPLPPTHTLTLTLTCRRNTSSSPRRGWQRAPGENLEMHRQDKKKNEKNKKSHFSLLSFLLQPFKHVFSSVIHFWCVLSYCRRKEVEKKSRKKGRRYRRKGKRKEGSLRIDKRREKMKKGG